MCCSVYRKKSHLAPVGVVIHKANIAHPTVASGSEENDSTCYIELAIHKLRSQETDREGSDPRGYLDQQLLATIRRLEHGFRVDVIILGGIPAPPHCLENLPVVDRLSILEPLLPLHHIELVDRVVVLVFLLFRLDLHVHPSFQVVSTSGVPLEYHVCLVKAMYSSAMSHHTDRTG